MIGLYEWLFSLVYGPREIVTAAMAGSIVVAGLACGLALNWWQEYGRWLALLGLLP